MTVGFGVKRFGHPACSPYVSAIYNSTPKPYSNCSGLHMGGCQNYGPFLGPDYHTAPIISGTPNGAIILTTAQYEGIGLRILLYSKPHKVGNRIKAK